MENLYKTLKLLFMFGMFLLALLTFIFRFS
ncbi:MAG: putative holin-like toxin [Defluviitaleaceae bacterium]|nr:putative holin-like toxin [Defluviitaleaceae bacterium]MCL2264132.1 putative holin-like toxin [Defluviitaleaceae bacterium]